MQRIGRKAIYPKKKTTIRNPEHKIYPYLLRDLPIVRPNQVWQIDITYIKMPGFYWRLSYYLLLDLLILWHYKDKMFAAFKSIFEGINTKYKFSWKAYALIPVILILLECLPFLIRLIWGIIFHSKQTVEQYKSLESAWHNFLNWLNN